MKAFISRARRPFALASLSKGHRRDASHADVQMGGQKYKRFRKSGDLISGLDGGAMTYKGSLNPKEAHSYQGY